MNNNIQENLVGIKVGKLLREKGFDVPCHTFVATKKSNYGELDEVVTDPDATYYNSLFDTFAALPTQQLAIDWIRVNFGIHITEYFLGDEPLGYSCTIQNKKGNVLKEITSFNTPEEAKEATLEYVLTELI